MIENRKKKDRTGNNKKTRAADQLPAYKIEKEQGLG